MEHTAFSAKEYDFKIRQTLPFYEELYEQVVDVLDISGKKSISWLDVGCGTGKMYEAARKRVSIQVSVQVHHSFVDGIHIGQFADMLRKYMDEY